jgi:hypothetical protein
MAKKVSKRELKELETEGKRLRALIDEFAENLGDGDEILVADGLDAAIIGITEGVAEPVVAYDYDKCVEIFRIRDGMTEEDALEHMSFNVTGAYVGPRTPIFIRFLS